MTQGYVAMILHAHLPFVHHPENDSLLEERWLFEAISETYIPLITSFEKLLLEGVDYRATMSITPPLLSMLTNSLLQERYILFLEKLIDLAEHEILRTQDHPDFNHLAIIYRDKYKNDLRIFRDVYDCNLVTAFKKLQEAGVLEIIASAATHGFLPLLDTTRYAVRAQIGIGVKSYEKHFGVKPKGIWLPECGYIPSIEDSLKEFGIEYFVTESHGLLFANPKPVYGTYAPIVTTNGMVAFGRDIESSKQVWSSTDGYPGDFDYREYYRDIGYDLDYEYIKEYISRDGNRINTGIKYHRITGKTEDKKPYKPEWAQIKQIYMPEILCLTERNKLNI